MPLSKLGRDASNDPKSVVSPRVLQLSVFRWLDPPPLLVQEWMFYRNLLGMMRMGMRRRMKMVHWVVVVVKDVR